MDTDFSGDWHIQHGSAMTLYQDANGNLTGTYRTAVGNPDPSTHFDIVGVVLEDTLSFTVRWRNTSGDFGSITAWVGQLTVNNSTDVLETLWHLTADVPDANEPASMWRSIFTGADYFERGAALTPPTPFEFAQTPSHPTALVPKNLKKNLKKK